MGKLDIVFKVAAPIAKDATKEIAKLTGKGLKLAGKGIKEAGSKAAEMHKDNEGPELQEQLQSSEEFYPGCQLMIAFEATHFNRHKLNEMGLELRLLDIDHTMHFFFDETKTMKYKVDEYYDSLLRNSVLSDLDGAIGSIQAHRRIRSSERESIYLRGDYLFDLDGNYQNGFSTTELSVAMFNNGDYRIIKNGLVAMDVSRYKG